MPIQEIDGQDEAELVALSNEDALYPLHNARLDANLLADDEFIVGFETLSMETGTKKFDLSIFQWNGVPPVAHDMQDTRRLKHPSPLAGADANK